MAVSRFLQILRTGALTLGLTATGLAQADYIWLQPEGGQMQVHVGELLRATQPPITLAEAKLVIDAKKSQPLQAKNGTFSFAAPAKGDARFSAAEAGQDGVLTYYHARFGRSETQAFNDLELVPTEANGNTFKLMFKGRAVSASQVNIETSEGWHRSLAPREDGTVSFNPSFPGLYVLEVTARVNNASVTLNGKKYEDVRHTATLAFDVPK